ncbi:usherin [Pelobates cultripes]|uniref:Usherin n=1 Tax=Pelobates cultripes TaxID=61616 RepID=A0AAD1RH02_PELCU|nr:usherin [Pelobates cultripes]
MGDRDKGMPSPLFINSNSKVATKGATKYLKVHHTIISFFINGLEEDSTPFDSRSLSGPISDGGDHNSIVLGQNTNGIEQFIGRMQDFRLYEVALTNREIVEVFSGDFPYLHVQSECRCTGSHPRIHPFEQIYCIPNGINDTTKDRILRLNPNSHPVSYINDKDLETTWISRLLSSSDIDTGITITIDLLNGQFQVFYVIIQFYSPMPQALKIQRQKHANSTWEDWQYFASDCQNFGMENNGILNYPDSVNCQQLPKNTPYSRGNVTFSILKPEPSNRPGYKDFYNTHSLQEFVKTSGIRIHMTGQYHTELNDHIINNRHRYYGISEITVSGRCICHGHAEYCDKSVTPYRCLCHAESHTSGTKCDQCLPLYNNKQFRQGDQVNAFNCKPCQCYNHSFSCHYNVSLDPYPNDHDRGGGGVCDNCLHNTAGKNCEWCKDLFYRELNSNLFATDVCKSCNCNVSGTISKNLQCQKIGGQCDCKPHVTGRQCDQCKNGFYNLQPDDSYGCQPCKCSIFGSINGSIDCHQTTGQCKCKPNFIGLHCDRCNLGFKQHNPLGEESCEPCKCSTNGSINQFCNPTSGQCKCKENVKGLACDTCIDNYYGLDTDRCKHCDCYREGIISGTVCDRVTGQCVCQPNIGGQRCNECLSGYYKVQQNNSMACLPCRCDVSGTINSSQSCDNSSGQCLCKALVTGQQCNMCISHTYNLTIGNVHGCQNCACHPLGTLESTSCNQTDGQCKCLPNYHGRMCNECRPGFYLSAAHGMKCVPCMCHSGGSANGICNSTNGQCVCQDSSITGQKCDRCHDLYYGFHLNLGRCRTCSCNAAGAVNGSCHSVTGQCFCKQFVRGFICDHCVEDASNLDAQNPYGCSTTPLQQPPPRINIYNSTAIGLTWNPPDSPNTNIINYVLYRDGIGVYNITDHFPFTGQEFECLQSFTDTPLFPYTGYTYQIKAINVHGYTSSSEVLYRTKAGTPTGEIILSHSPPVDPYSVSLSWTMTSEESGPIEKFQLMYSKISSLEPNISYEGPDMSVTVHNLTPFTRYNFLVQACTTEGCLQSLPVTVVTPQAPPAHQDPPTQLNASSTELHLQWSPPTQPNGIIIRYELFMRGVENIHGNYIPTERRVFHTTGWLNPQPVVESENENALKPPATNTTISHLEPYTKYEFCIVSANMAGSVTSKWVEMKTKESVPVYMPHPTVFPLSPRSLNVSWEKPTNSDARGEIVGYTINMISGEIPDQSQTAAGSEVLYVAEANELFYEVTGLKPYHVYNFTITLCNGVGCVTSKPGGAQTLASAPQHFNAPQVKGINSTTMMISWAAPMDLNGPLPFYQLIKVDSSLTMKNKMDFVKGTRFPGNGYVKFPPSTLPMNSYFTGIKIQFRTKEPDGLLLCAVSAGMQEEYIVLQMRNGRPYFLFDPQGSAVSVSPTNDGGKKYNDNKWHQVVATRTQASGYITVDGQYTGSSAAKSGGTVIGENTGVFIGGFPNYFSLRKNDRGDTQITEKHFVGCLGEILIQKSDNPHEIWEALEFNNAVETNNVYEKWEGCPDSAEEGAHFLGFGFLELQPNLFSVGQDFELSFLFKTDQLKGVLLFAYANQTEYFIMQLKNGILNTKLKKQSTLLDLDLWAGLSYCDGSWNSVYFRKEGTLFLVQLNNLVERFTQPILHTGTSVISALYIGGVPEDVHRIFSDLNLQQGFGGCMKDLRFTQGVAVNFATASYRTVRVNLDGCPSTDSPVNCRGNDSIIVYRGKEQTVYESDLEPFTEYLYRVVASNDGGSVTSAWNQGRTRAEVPADVCSLGMGFNAPTRLLNISGYSAEVAWARPLGVRGVIEKYLLKAYPENTKLMRLYPRISEISATGSKGTLKGLLPFTKYAVTLSVCTSSGCSESSHVLHISTLEEVPEDVQIPTVKSFPNSLYLYWSPPRKPNGKITKYILFVDRNQIYMGNETEFNVTAAGGSLTCSEPYRGFLSVCTIIGCSNSTQVIVSTAQAPPDYVAAPVVTVLDSRSIHVEWEEPSAANGILERYIIYMSTNSIWNVIYNSTDLFLDYTIRELTPGIKYLIKISACTAGGCTTSDASTCTTEESSPESVQTPKIESYTPDSFNISWSKPLHPNGIITSYGLYMDGILMQNSSQLSFFVDGLSPWSKHSFRLQACTSKGCALGRLVEAYTQESKPEGVVLVHAVTDGPRGIQMKWQGPERPNGNVTYNVIFEGLFYVMKGWKSKKSQIKQEKPAIYLLMFSSLESNKWISIDGLVPFSNYSIRINASNNQGFVMSNPILLTLPPGAPDGILPPRLSSATPTSLQVVWSTPVRNNAPGLPEYRLQMRSSDPTNEITDLYSGSMAFLTYAMKDLQPFTTYEVRIAAFNKYGATNSNWISMSTEEDRPGPIDQPLFSNINSTSLTITWKQPSQTNGVITHYNIYQNDSFLVTVPGTSLGSTIENLIPYTNYKYQLEGCTSAGCSKSQESSVKTLPGAPSGILPPDLYSDTPTSVVIRWKPPIHSNGLIANYAIERRIKGKDTVYQLVTLPKDHPMQYIDRTMDISPWKTFEYRIVVSVVDGGNNGSSWSEVTTRPSRPGGVQPPEVYILGPYTAKVIWKMPLIPNGDILSYEICMPEPKITIINTTLLNYTVTNLIPYTNYSVTIVACSGGDIYHGGCTESLPTYATTHSALPQGISPLSVTPVSETCIAVSWQAPSMPNGPQLRYELLRRKILQPLASNPPEDLNLWQNIYSGTQWFYEDKGLSRYTSYQYRLIVHNMVGYTSGTDVTVTTMAGPPVKGSNVTALTVNHTAIQVKWSKPWVRRVRSKVAHVVTFAIHYLLKKHLSVKKIIILTIIKIPLTIFYFSFQAVHDLQGDVELYTLFLNSSKSSKTMTFSANMTSATIGNLYPNTKYQLSLQVFNGVHRINSDFIHVTTMDGVKQGLSLRQLEFIQHLLLFQEPEGMFPPEVAIINHTAVRVIWTSPSNPNGAVTEYSIYVNNKVYKTRMNSPGAFIVGDLSPYTVYNINVCTIYACTKSNSTRISTVEDKPRKVHPPIGAWVNTARVIHLRWMFAILKSAKEPNGIILGFTVWRKTLHRCSFVQTLSDANDFKSCAYVKCKKNEDICGDTCYNPDHQECCDGVLHDRRVGYWCCEDDYILSSQNTSVVCCGGHLHRVRPEFRCCGRYYTRVQAGEACCYNTMENSVAVGDGDSCCGGIPYLKSGNQMCCGRELYDKYNQQCCGERIIGLNYICCGDEQDGTTHRPSPGLDCCGTEFVNISESICCADSSGQVKVHLKPRDHKPLKCCDTQLISENEECCNGVGYNPLIHECANKLSAEINNKKRKCGLNVFCPISLSAMAYCGRCSFNSATDSCWMTKTALHIKTNADSIDEEYCPTEEEITYVGGPDNFNFTDTGLEPFTTYEYRLSPWNSFSHGFSHVTRVTTNQDIPQGVDPPRWTIVDNREYVISLSWKEPDKSNGIMHYVILRDGTERYKGISKHFLDKGGINQFQEYSYQLRACTVSGCLDSAKVLAAIKQDVPKGVSPPLITTVNSTALYLSWLIPSKPNGRIKRYQVNHNDDGVIYVTSEGHNEYTVTGLQPFTKYSFSLTVCTSAGCTTSEPSTGVTAQDVPQGVWSKPRHVIINTTALELYWSEPEKPNGMVLQYRLKCNGEIIANRSGEYLSFTDVGLQPNSRYFYQLEASTEAGSTNSDFYIIETPAATPEDIPAPYNITTLGPHTIYVAWNVPGVYNSSIPLKFYVLLNAGSTDSEVHPAGEENFILVENLNPYTQYNIRIQACQNGGCGAGFPMSVLTEEAAPEEFDPPLVSVAGPKLIQVAWKIPKKANGVIVKYVIYRRCVGQHEILPIFIWTEGPLVYMSSSNDLLPYTQYEYCITAQNSKGSVKSSWSMIYTLESEPQDLEPPTAQVTSAYSVFINWMPPMNPNGVIKYYYINYYVVVCREAVYGTSCRPQIRDRPIDRRVLWPPVGLLFHGTCLGLLPVDASAPTQGLQGTSNHAKLYGLLPFTKYEICIEALNSAGKVSSQWVYVQTSEASPSGLSNFVVEKKEDGRALLLEWSEPRRPNGVLQKYNIYSDGNLEYSGLNHQFLFQRLEPYTVYKLVLEACTVAGCTQTLLQLVQTKEASPTTQLPVAIESINSTHIVLSWSPPIYPNGQINQYDVIKKCSHTHCLGTTKNADGYVVHSEYNTKHNTFRYTDNDVRPWNIYEYKIRAWNSAGSTNSSWTEAQTAQAAPSNLLPPKLYHLEVSPNQLTIKWSPPEEENGIIMSYRLQRNNITLPFSFDSSTFCFTDGNLLAYFEYSYSVIACTIGGCTTSPSNTIKTLEAPPGFVSPPNVELLSATEVNTSWSAPLMQNGEITKYILKMEHESYFAGKGLWKVISNLEPFTMYNVSLISCTSGGCTSSLPIAFRTMEDRPTDMKAPIFKVTGPESIEIMWQTPSKPNGEIKGYELRRDDLLIYVGMDTHYHDSQLEPGTEYIYSIQANNNHGSSERSSAKIKTHPSLPYGMQPPKMQAKSAHEILLTWSPPSRTNGDIIKYLLLIRCPFELREEKQYHFNNSLTTQMSHSFTVTDLKPFKQYEAKIEACTLVGCVASEWVTGTTLEAPPESQPQPLIDMHMNPQVPLIMWNAPPQPNGKILYYELYRRQITDIKEMATTELVYNGSETAYKDINLLPYTEYKYQVWAVNSAGRRPSPWVYCRTGPAAPEAVHAPVFESVSSTSALATIPPPSKPNGIITLYSLFSSTNKGTYIVLSEGTSNQQTIYGLKPFTKYSVGVEACTCLKCCSRGPVVQITTLPAPPSHQLPPRVTSRTSRSASFQWNGPQSPNGIIQRYEIQMQVTCPQPYQIIGISCTPGQIEEKYSGNEDSCNVTSLQPYTSYSVRVISYNSVGSTDSEWIVCTTLKEKPQYKSNFIVSSNITALFLDWSVTFLLNGILKEYVLTERGQKVYSGLDSSVYIQRTTDKTLFFQVTCTTDMGTVSSPIVKYSSVTGLAPVQSFPSGKNGTVDRGNTFYNELWFIILMALLGLVLLAIILSLLLQRKLNKQPCPRDRPPLVPLQQRMSPASGYSQNEAYTKYSLSDSQHAMLQAPTVQIPIEASSQVSEMGISEIKIPSTDSPTSHRTMVRKTSHSQISHSFSQNSLYQSASQLLNSHDKKSLGDGSIWDSIIQGHDSGMYADDDDLISTIKSFSTVTKQHTAFTDTPL